MWYSSSCSQLRCRFPCSISSKMGKKCYSQARARPIDWRLRADIGVAVCIYRNCGISNLSISFLFTPKVARSGVQCSSCSSSFRCWLIYDATGDGHRR